MHYSKKRRCGGAGNVRKVAGGIAAAGLLIFAAVNAGLIPGGSQESDAAVSDRMENAVSSTDGVPAQMIEAEAGGATDSASAVLDEVYAPKPSEPADTRSPEVSLADCLTASGARLYGAEWCPHCQAQKAAFGEAISRINFIECADESAPNGQSEACAEARIASYPTWIFGDGSRLTGQRTMWELARKSGCEWGG